MVLVVELVILVGSETTSERQKSEDNWLRRLLGDGDEVSDEADETLNHYIKSSLISYSKAWI